MPQTSIESGKMEPNDGAFGSAIQIQQKSNKWEVDPINLFEGLHRRPISQEDPMTSSGLEPNKDWPFLIFKQKFSRPMMIRMIRLHKAQELLKNQSLTIATIAYESGFNDPDYMAKVFKREFGMPPTAFRLAQRAMKKS